MTVFNDSLAGPPTRNIDGRAKVTGAAVYGSDFAIAGAAHAVLKTSTIAKGRIVSINDIDARRVRGVIEILTFRNVGDRIKPGALLGPNGYMASTIAPLASDRIFHSGQIVAMVVAETFEAAREAAWRLDVRYEEERPTATFDEPGADDKDGPPRNPQIGDFAEAFASAPVKIDAVYETPPQHHNAMELFGSLAAWDGGRLTVWESNRNLGSYKFGLADQLGIDASDIRILSPLMGGSFGARGSLPQYTAIVALAARMIGRPVKLVATREQGFTIVHHRTETRHHMQLAASRDGKLTALRHEAWEVTSRVDNTRLAGTGMTTRIYGCPNIDSKVSTIGADRQTPGSMRSPAELPYLFALESAMDELAYALQIDPVRLRLINDTMVEPIGGLPYSSRNLKVCFEEGAARFGWERRTPEPRSMRDGDWLVGWGTATTAYPAYISPCAVRIRLMPNGRATVETATHELGQGVKTAIAVTASQGLGLPVERIEVRVGDTDLPPAPLTGGSVTTSSVCGAVAAACEEMRGRIARAAVADPAGPFPGADAAALRLQEQALALPDGRREALADAMRRVAAGMIEVYLEHTPSASQPGSAAMLYKGTPAITGGAYGPNRVQVAFGAQFVEVKVHSRTGEIRASRALGAYSFGRIVNPIAAKGQLMGGQIWGISSALHEATEIDPRTARYVNHDFAEYLIPVNADITDIETIMLPQRDEHLPLGIMGAGELGNVGMNAAIANAVFHATGVRVRKLPVRIEGLLT